MQGTEGQDQVPAADFESISQQLATGFLRDGERASQSIIFGSEAVDPQVHHDDDKERDHEPEVLLPTAYHRMPLKVLLVHAWATHTGTQHPFSKLVSTGPHR
jgi:hypothetical protein